MLLAARFILGASLYRTESRLSHFREDHDQRDDKDWLVWVDFCETGNGPAFSKTPVPTPLCPPTLSKPRTAAASRAPSGGRMARRDGLARQDDEIGVRAGFAADAVVGHDQRGAG